MTLIIIFQYVVKVCGLFNADSIIDSLVALNFDSVRSKFRFPIRCLKLRLSFVACTLDQRVNITKLIELDHIIVFVVDYSSIDIATVYVAGVLGITCKVFR